MGTANLQLKTAKKDGWACPFCNKIFRVRRDLEAHKKEIHKLSRLTPATYEKSCPFCKKSWITTNSGYTNHVKSCEMNPNRVSGNWKGHHHTDEQKKKISESRKKYLEEHPDKVPFKLNHSSKESYPEKYFREWLQKENIFSEKEYQVGRYTLDFAWPEKGIYIEIDGSQHSLDWMQEHDKIRTDYLSNKGWICLARVYWPHFKTFSLNEKEQFLLQLKNSIVFSKVFKDFKSEKERLKEIKKKEAEENKRKRLKRTLKKKRVSEENLRKNQFKQSQIKQEWQRRKDLILSCGVDLKKYGWKEAVQKATGLTRKQVNLTINKFYDDFKNLIFIRN